jgi:hypothetical protein
VNFNPTWEIETAWRIPLAFTGLPLRLDGFMNVVGPKGRDGFGADTEVEVLAEPQLTLDLGQLVFDRPHKLDAFVGYQYLAEQVRQRPQRGSGQAWPTPSSSAPATTSEPAGGRGHGTARRRMNPIRERQDRPEIRWQPDNGLPRC